MTEQQFLEHDWFDRPLPANVHIGDRSWLYSSYAFRHYCSAESLGVEIGTDSGLYNGTFFDLGPRGSVTIGDFCTIVGGIFCTNRAIHIGDYVFIAHEVVIADRSVALPSSGRDVRQSSLSMEEPAASTRIGEGAWIAARACLIGPVSVGAHAIIGAGSVVTDDVPDGCIVGGNPAKTVGKVH